MNTREQLNGYLRALEMRLRWMVVSRGAAITAGVALGATLALVLITNELAFSSESLTIARVALFLALAAALAYALVLPLMRLNQRRTAGRAEVVFPQFQERLLTYVERSESKDPMLELLAADTHSVAKQTQPQNVAPPKSIFAFATGAGAAGAILLWLILAGPGFLGFGANLLWAGSPKSGIGASYYDIQVTPGNKLVRRRDDVPITATLSGFQAPEVRLFTRFKSSTKWETVNMLPRASSSAYEFNFAALSEPLEYYVEAGGVKSKTYKLDVVDLPAITHVRTTYHLPSWLGMADRVEDPSGDLRAVVGTVAEVAIQTDKPLQNGVIEMEDGTRIPFTAGAGGTLVAKVPLQKDGLYHIAALEQGDSVRLTADYFIEAQEDQAPSVKLTHPTGDAKVLPIEEVTVNVQADDDFALEGLDLHYSVNGTPEKVISLLPAKGVKSAEGKTMLSLEDFKLSPGDIVSIYATARDARSTSQTDISFIEALPYERNVSQSQQGGAGGGGGGQQQGGDPAEITRRQKQIITATHNALRPKDKSATPENAKYLSDTEATLKAQVESLVARAAARELTDNSSVQEFAKEMKAAADEMGPASDKLKAQAWKDATPPEEKALQHLERAEATYRDIQVAFGRNGGGGGGGGGANAGRDLANLFDLELDTQKNQYEQQQQPGGSAEQRQKDVDDAMQKLDKLAQRAQELAQKQQNNKQQTMEQKYEQDSLRKEAEDLKKQLEQLQQQQQQQQGQQSQQSQGQQSQGQQSQGKGGQGQGQQQSKGGQSSQQMQRTIDQLTQGIKDMQAAQQALQQGQSGESQSQAEARKAAEHLKEAQDAANSMRRQDAAGQVSSLADRAEKLAAEQHDIVDKMKQQLGDSTSTDPRERTLPGSQSRQTTEQIAALKDQEAKELESLQKDVQQAAKQLQTTQPAVSKKLRDGVSETQQADADKRIQDAATNIRRGYGNLMTPREVPVTQSLDALKDQLQAARQAMENGNQQGAARDDRERTLNQIESLRAQLERLQQQGQGQQGQGQQGQGQPQGQGQQGQGKGGQQQGKGGQGGQGQGQQNGGQQNGGANGGAYANPNGGGYNAGARLPNGGYINGPNNGAYDPRLGPNRQSPQGVYDVPDPQFAATPAQAGRDMQRQLDEIKRAIKDDANLLRQVNDVQQALDQTKIGDIASPELAERIARNVLPKLESLEVEVRRANEEKGVGQARAGVTDKVPAGYQPQVEEYTRKLSNTK